MSRRLQLSVLIAILIILLALLFYFLLRMEDIQVDRRVALTQAAALATQASGMQANVTAVGAERGTAIANMETARLSADEANSARETALAMAMGAWTSEAAAYIARETAVAQANIAAAGMAEAERVRNEALAQAEAAFATGTPLALALATAQQQANDYFATAESANALLQLFEADVQLDITPMELTAVPSSALGPLYTASTLNAQGCPLDIRQVFTTGAPVVFAVATNASIRAGSSVSARWYRSGAPYRESPAFSANQDYVSVCIAFSLEPDAGAQFEPGVYQVEFLVDGAPAGSLSFMIETGPA